MMVLQYYIQITISYGSSNDHRKHRVGIIHRRWSQQPVTASSSSALAGEHAENTWHHAIN